MKFRNFSIFAGIGQAIAMLVVYDFIGFILRTWVPDRFLSFEALSLGAVVWLVVCIIIGLVYPIQLLRHKQKMDAVVVLSSTLMSIVFVLFLGYLMAN